MTGDQGVKPQNPHQPNQEQEADTVPATECFDCWRADCICPSEPSYSEQARGER